jgi:hypothetical protein
MKKMIISAAWRALLLNAQGLAPREMPFPRRAIEMKPSRDQAMDNFVKAENSVHRSLPERALAESLGHAKAPLLTIIRAKCIDCSGASLAEVRRCSATKCALWPYRGGANPFRDSNPRAAENFRQLLGENPKNKNTPMSHA